MLIEMARSNMVSSCVGCSPIAVVRPNDHPKIQNIQERCQKIPMDTAVIRGFTPAAPPTNTKCREAAFCRTVKAVILAELDVGKQSPFFAGLKELI